MIQDMVNDLSGLDLRDLEKGIEAYRKTMFPPGKFKPFPDSGTLIHLAAVERKHREDMARLGGPVKPLSRPLMWWHRPMDRWSLGWLESDVLAGELVRDTADQPLREPRR